MRALIIDDEEHCHQTLQGILNEHYKDIEILTNGYSVEEGVRLINRHQPDLVFLDVEMPDGTGFDLLRKLDKPTFHVIFVTAHNHYAQMAIRSGALDYLTKPVREENLKLAIDRAIEKNKEKATLKSKEQELQEQIQLLLENFHNLNLTKKLPTRLAVSTLEGIHYIEVKDIIRLEAQQNYTAFTIDERKQILLSSNNLGEYVDHFEFYPNLKRVHRSHIVNLAFVVKYIRGDNVLVMKNGDKVSVARGYRDDLLDDLKHF